LRIAAPSFIIPAGRVENAQYLTGTVDEVELLYMDSLKLYDLPDASEISQLTKISLPYNIHMPYDRDLSVGQEWDTIYKFAETLKCLNARTHTFHIQQSAEFYVYLQEYSDKTGMHVTVENASADTAAFAECSFPICLDIGHIVMSGVDPIPLLDKYADRIYMFHLHGVKDGRDHQSLKYLDKMIIQRVAEFANERELTVSIEVFSEDKLRESLDVIHAL
jgi:hypothetical protein